MEPTLADRCNGSHLSGQHNLNLHFTDVSYARKRHNSSESVQILQDACGEFKAGRLVAILGASGAGKTSLLNVLSGFKGHGVTGHFLLNGEQRDLVAFRKISSYIEQDFHILPLLTVGETLKIAADLTLPKHVGVTEKQKIIDEIVKILNLENCRNTLVAAISGGELKRLSIGTEMVTNPPVMFFDEPTSGLDCVSSYQLLKYLYQLAQGGRIIVCVVHQPSSKQMKLFDDVLVLSDGQVLYSGPQDDMLDFFEQDGFSCPKYYNPADYVLEVSAEPQHKLVNLVNRNKSMHRREDYADVTCRKIDERTKMLDLNGKTEATRIEMSDISGDSEKEQSVAFSKPSVSPWVQFTVLTKRSLKCMSRNWLEVQLRFIMHILIAIMLGLVYYKIGNDGARVLSNTSCIFFTCLFVFFGNAMPSTLAGSTDILVFLSEYRNGRYSLLPYYCSKIVADFPVQLLCPSIFVSIVYFMTSQPVETDRFFMFWGMCFLSSIVGHMLGLVIGSLFDLKMAVFLVPASTIPMMVFSGYFVRMHELSDYLRLLCDISVFRYTLEGMTVAVYGNGRQDLECHDDFCYFKTPEKFLKEMDMLTASYFFDAFALIVWIVILKISYYVVLRRRIRKAE